MGFSESIGSFHEGFIETLKTLFGVGGQPSSYVCTDCGHEFEAAADHPDDAECPACGGTDIGTRKG